MDKPNNTVKLVFEQIGEIVDAESVIGLKVYLEMPDRKITEEILEGTDKTAAEVWATEMFDLVSQLLHEKAEHTEGIEVYDMQKKGDLS